VANTVETYTVHTYIVHQCSLNLYDSAIRMRNCQNNRQL